MGGEIFKRKEGWELWYNAGEEWSYLYGEAHAVLLE
jgi:hypothetical protein